MTAWAAGTTLPPTAQAPINDPNREERRTDDLPPDHLHEAAPLYALRTP